MKKTSVAACCIVLIAICSLFTECKKSNDTSKSKLLMSAPWKYKEAGIDLNNGSGVTPIPASLNPFLPCQLDNTVTFKTDTTGVIDEGATKCPPMTDPQSTVFKYTYNSSTNALHFSPPILGSISDAKVIDITSTQLKISTPVTQTITGLPPNSTIVVTLIH